MRSLHAEPAAAGVDGPPGRRFFVVWQDPRSRRFHPVGVLLAREGAFEFWYVKNAASLPGFRPLAAFPDVGRRYSSQVLPAFFANRVMSPSRPDYQPLLHAVGISELGAEPLELLARTGGPRLTDTFQIAAEPEIVDGRATSQFLVSGIRHAEDAEARMARVRPGDELSVRDQPDNPVNRFALLLDRVPGEEIGWLPDWLVGFAQDLRTLGIEPRIVVEHVGEPGTPPHLRLLCRLEADLPAGYRPFSGAEYEPLAQGT